MDKTAKRFKESLAFPTVVLVLMWAVFLLTRLFGMRGITWGVYPREIYGVKGIITSPFIHGDLAHILSNSVPMFVLTFMLFFFYRRIAYKAFFFIFILTGLSVWLFGRDVWHVGASGVVYGLVSFIFWSGIFRRNIRSIILALIVMLLYSGLFFGLVPQEGISWESHLMGALVGILVSYIFKNSIEQEENVQKYSYYEDNEDEDYFLARDTFMMTRQEREQYRQEQLRKQRGSEGHWNSDWTR